MEHLIFFADGLSVQQLVYSASGLVLQIGVGIGVIFIIRAAVETVGFLGKISTRVGNAGKGLTQKAEDRAHQSKFYQNRQMARDFKTQERKRAATEDFAEKMRDSRRWRRRAAGRYNEAGQQRAYVGGVAARQKAEREEISSADMLLEATDMQGMGVLATIAQGREAVHPISGARLSGAGNPALQRAAMKRIIQAEDSTGLETLLMSTSTDHAMLRSEISAAYPTAKKAGAHFVDSQVLGAGRAMSRTELDQAAVRGQAGLKYKALAGQDNDSTVAMERGWEAGGMGAGDPKTLSQRQYLWDMVQEVYSDPTALQDVKPRARAAMDRIYNAARPTK